jgi:YidC/Oxa1 family membrane protein insertase
MDDSNKRVILAFGLSFAILVLWRMAFPPPVEPPPKTPAPAQAPAAVPKPATPAASAPAAPAAAPPAPVALPVQQGSKAEEIVVENDVARVTFSTEGGVVKSWILKRFTDEKGQPLDVVNRQACETLGFPISLVVSDPELTKQMNAAIFVGAPAGSPLKAPVKLELAYSDGKIQVRKKFTFAAGYEVRAEASVFDGQRYLPVEVAWPGGFGDHSLPPERALLADHAFFQASGSDKPQVESLTASFFDRFSSSKPGATPGRADVPGPLILGGLEDRYFAGVFLPEAPDQGARFERQAWTPPEWKGEESARPSPITAWFGTAAPKPVAFRMFVGPKDLGVLRETDPPLDRLVDFGWFSFVARPIFLGMRYIHDHWTHNFGWAIVLLTILINIALFPIKLKQIRAGQEMQRIAPLMKSIQDKYKGYKLNDPRRQKMNQEMMKLYQEHHINPLSGCLPMLIQLPFFYGFYKVLDLSIELRHAPWMLWVKDLSAYDPYYILPVLMTVTMFILQKMTPMTTADPAQQRMFMLMPLFMGFFFLKLASGLVLYWLTGNVLGIVQQAFINRFMPRPALAVAPSARKAVAKGS